MLNREKISDIITSENMERINKILRASVARKGLKKPVEAAEICFYASKWVYNSFEPISFSNGVLKVSVSSSSAASELQMKLEDLIDYLNDEMGKAMVKQVRIVVGKQYKRY